MLRIGSYLIASALALAAVPASAGVLFTTYDGLPYHASDGISDFNGVGQSMAIPFSLSLATIITGVQVAVFQHGTSDYMIAIESDAGGLPSGTILDSGVLSNGSAPGILSGLSWNLNPGNYWLAVMGDSSSYYGGWEYGAINAISAYTTFGGPVNTGWQTQQAYNLPEAIIMGDVPAAVPEPSALALLLMGLLGLGAIHRRV